MTAGSLTPTLLVRSPHVSTHRDVASGLTTLVLSPSARTFRDASPSSASTELDSDSERSSPALLRSPRPAARKSSGVAALAARDKRPISSVGTASAVREKRPISLDEAATAGPPALGDLGPRAVAGLPGCVSPSLLVVRRAALACVPAAGEPGAGLPGRTSPSLVVVRHGVERPCNSRCTTADCSGTWIAPTALDPETGGSEPSPAAQPMEAGAPCEGVPTGVGAAPSRSAAARPSECQRCSGASAAKPADCLLEALQLDPGEQKLYEEPADVGSTLGRGKPGLVDVLDAEPQEAGSVARGTELTDRLAAGCGAEPRVAAAPALPRESPRGSYLADRLAAACGIDSCTASAPAAHHQLPRGAAPSANTVREPEPQSRAGDTLPPKRVPGPAGATSAACDWQPGDVNRPLELLMFGESPSQEALGSAMLGELLDTPPDAAANTPCQIEVAEATETPSA